MEFKVHHIAISVSNIEKSQEFYSIFGAKEVASYETEELKIKHLLVGDIILELFAFKDFVRKENLDLWEDLKITGVKHVAFQVKDIKKAKEFLIEKGIADKNTEIKVGRTGILYFFIKDPDGNFVEIVEDNRKF